MVGGCLKRPYHKPPTTLSKNNQNHPNHQKRANLMEINRNGRGYPRRTLPKTPKTTKPKQPKQAHTLANSKGNGRGCPKGPYHKPQQTLSKNNQNHQHHQKRANPMEINRNGRGCPRRTLPKTTKATEQKQPKQAKTLANLMEIRGNGRGCPRVPYHKPPKTLSKHNQNHQKH